MKNKKIETEVRKKKNKNCDFIKNQKIIKQTKKKRKEKKNKRKK